MHLILCNRQPTNQEFPVYQLQISILVFGVDYMTLKIFACATKVVYNFYCDAYVNESRLMILVWRRGEECRGSWWWESHDLKSPSILFM